jgi:toxin CcdB
MVMPQFAVYQNKYLRGSGFYPLLVDVQTELLQDLATRVVVPLARGSGFIDFPLSFVMPTIELEGERYVLMTPRLAGVSRSDLGPHVSSAEAHTQTISTALDFVFRGF